MPELTKLRIAFLKIRQDLFVFLSFLPQIYWVLIWYFISWSKKTESVVYSWTTESSLQRNLSSFLWWPHSKKVNLDQSLLPKTCGCHILCSIKGSGKSRKRRVVWSWGPAFFINWMCRERILISNYSFLKYFVVLWLFRVILFTKT